MKEIKVSKPGLQEDSDHTAWEPISRTVPVRSSCLGSAPGGVLVAAAIFTGIKTAVEIIVLFFPFPYRKQDWLLFQTILIFCTC